jgi:hypothetical protein
LFRAEAGKKFRKKVGAKLRAKFSSQKFHRYTVGDGHGKFERLHFSNPNDVKKAAHRSPRSGRIHQPN